MIEALPLSFMYTVLKDLCKRVFKKSHFTPEEILDLRQKWKPLFEMKIIENQIEKLRKDIVIRDLKRFDSYPNIDDTRKGISPWFRVGLIGTYHKGILVGLQWNKIKKHDDEGNWRYTNDSISEQADLKVILVGKIPFENIASVDWNGDEYYSFPHVYCRFNTKRKEPYEDVVFCEEKFIQDDGVPFYTDVASLDKVQKLSLKLGLRGH